MKEPLILNIETATDVCSVCLSKGNEVVLYKESLVANSHSKMLSLLIDEILKEKELKVKDLSCIAVGKGPGSYTGLRIGVSSAKGLAYGADIPIVSVDTLMILAHKAREKYKDMMYMPMIDARRMEVYTAIYDKDFNVIKPISADVVESDLYEDYLQKGKIVVVGTGSEKCKEVLTDSNYIFDNTIRLCAKDMIEFSNEKYKNKDFEDVAYFEPYYLKEFIAAKPHVKGLYD